MRDFGGAVPAGPAISHAIPSNVFHDLKSDRWNSADCALVWGRAELELHAKLRGLVSAMVLVPQGHCTACGGIALLSCQCNAVLSGALVLYLVHCFVAMKPLSPLRPGLRAWVKPPSPLLARNVCVALWASKGVAGFMRTREGASKGGGGFFWVRKSSPCGAVSSRKREKVRPARSKHPKFGVFVLAGRVFSRKSRWRGRAGRVFSRQRALCRSWMQRGVF